MTYRLTAYCLHEHGNLVVTLDTDSSDVELIMPMYRFQEQITEGSEHWDTFQAGAVAEAFIDAPLAPFASIQRLARGTYTIECKVLTPEFETIALQLLAITLATPELEINQQAQAQAFEESFTQLFKKFAAGSLPLSDAHVFFEDMTEQKLDFLFTGLINIGGPEDYLSDEEEKFEGGFELQGFFNFIDFVAGVTYHFGGAAKDRLERYPDSPSNSHYLHYVKQYIQDERFYAPILETYPYCRR